MRSTTAIAAAGLVGLALMLALESPALATGFARKYAAPGYSGPVTGTVRRHPARYFRCRGGRFYTFLGGWGCDYYDYLYSLPRRH